MAGRAFSFLAVAAVMALSLLAALPSAEARCKATDCPTCIKDIGCYWIDDTCHDGNPDEREDAVGHGEICPAPVSSPDTPFPGDDQRGTLSLERENDQLPILSLHHSGHGHHGHHGPVSHTPDSLLNEVPVELFVLIMGYLSCPQDVFNLAATCSSMKAMVQSVLTQHLWTFPQMNCNRIGLQSYSLSRSRTNDLVRPLGDNSGKVFQITFEGRSKIIMAAFDFELQVTDLRSSIAVQPPTPLEVLFAMPVDKALAAIKDYMGGGRKFADALEMTLTTYKHRDNVLSIAPLNPEFPLTLELSPNWGDDTIALPEDSDGLPRHRRRHRRMPSESQSSHPPPFTPIEGEKHAQQITAKRYIKLMRGEEVCAIIVVDPGSRHAYVLVSVPCVKHFVDHSSCTRFDKGM